MGNIIDSGLINIPDTVENGEVLKNMVTNILLKLNYISNEHANIFKNKYRVIVYAPKWYWRILELVKIEPDSKYHYGIVELELFDDKVL